MTYKTLVWDYPARILHWALALSVSLTFVFALAFDEHSSWFPLHMLCGLVSAFLVALRLVLGLVGSKHSRFTRFPVAPREILSYFKNLPSGQTSTYAGNNPGSAIAALLIYALVPFLVITGILMKVEIFEELHEVLAYSLLAVIGLHVAGLTLHALRHRDGVATSMIHGRKDVAPAEGIDHSRPWLATFILMGGTAWILALAAGYDPAQGQVKIPLLNSVVQLGEKENEGKSSSEHRREEKEEEDDD